MGSNFFNSENILLLSSQKFVKKKTNQEMHFQAAVMKRDRNSGQLGCSWANTKDGLTQRMCEHLQATLRLTRKSPAEIIILQSVAPLVPF